MKQNTEKRKNLKSTTQNAYRWWKEQSAIQPGDTVSTKVKKVAIKIGGVLALVVFSPIILAALLIALILAL